MPELPEVETIRRGLSAMVADDVIRSVDLRRPDLRVPFPPRLAERLRGRRIIAIDRRAKYLLFRLDNQAVFVAHLGMSGSFRMAGAGHDSEPGRTHRGASKSPAHDHVVLHLRSGARLIYNDPRRFGLMDIIVSDDLEDSPRFRDLGMEPLDHDFDADALARLFAGRRAPLKAALLDQKLIAGLGNIYVCEALWRARLSPERRAGSLVDRRGRKRPAAGRLAVAVQQVLGEAIAAGGSSLRDHIGAAGDPGAFQTRFAVYDRQGEPCLRPSCRGIVRRRTHGGRSTFFCAVCQR